MTQAPVKRSRRSRDEAARLDLFAGWYAPWRYADPSWVQPPAQGAGLLAALGATEPARRLNYRAWCAHLDLPLHPESCDGSFWWRAVGMPLQHFARLNYLVGLVLLLVRTPRARLTLAREAARVLSGTDAVRWALQRAGLVPARQFASAYWGGPDGGGADDPATAGGLAVRFAVGQRVPALLSRMRLRYARTAALQALWGAGAGSENARPEIARPEIAPGRSDSVGPDAGCASLIEKLWAEAERRAGQRP